jgi:signal transduction histidine kinase
MEREPEQASRHPPAATLPPVAEALTQAVDLGVMIIADDVVATVNRAFVGFFGAKQASSPLVGEPVETLSEREPFDAATSLWAARNDDYGRRYRCTVGDRVIEGRWHPLPSDGRRLLALIVRDLTSEVRVRGRLRQHNRALAELVASKTELVSALLHELRTPLTSALGMVDLLPEGRGDPLLDEALPMIARSLHRINDITAQIAAISGIESGAVPMEHREFDVPALLAEVAAVHGTTVRAQAAAPIAVGDPARLDEVFARLITAVRAVGGDADVITAELLDDRWRIALELPPQQATDRLFTAADSGGNATALMLARAVVGRHGGTVGVETVTGTPYLVVRLPRGGPSQP